jgi:hypothetical protein
MRKELTMRAMLARQILQSGAARVGVQRFYAALPPFSGLARLLPLVFPGLNASKPFVQFESRMEGRVR